MKCSLYVEEKLKINDIFKYDNYYINYFCRFIYIMDIVNDIMCFGCLIVVVKDLFLRGELIKII